MHNYIGIEDIGLTVAQRQQLVAALQTLAPNAGDPIPARRNHWRVRLDTLAAIFEADWGDDDITVAALKRYLGTVFSVDPATIAHTVASTAYGPVVTFQRPAGTNRLRLIQFGGAAPTLDESRAACQAYLAANAAAWEPAQP